MSRAATKYDGFAENPLRQQAWNPRVSA